jgi:hypothetical protein
VESADLKSQVEFWGRAGYDSIPLTVGMMNPGEVTKESSIYGWSRRRCARKGRRPFRENRGERVITYPEDFDRFP